VGTIDAVATTTGSRADVWALLADASTWSQWGSWSESAVEGGGEHGPGAVRVLVKKPFRLRERITDWAPDERMGYDLIDGMNVRGYHATVTLADLPGGGTMIRWHSTYRRAGPVTAVILRLAVRDACKRLANAAAAPAGPAAA
jgi:hypothetical protein